MNGRSHALPQILDAALLRDLTAQYRSELPTSEPIAGGLWLDDGLEKYSQGVPPSITTQPQAASVIEGNAATLAIVADNATTYRWQLDSGAGFADIAGADTASLVTTVLSAANDGDEYRCVLVGPGGTTTSAVAVVSVTTVYDQIADYFAGAGTGFWFQNDPATMVGVSAAGDETLNWQDQSGGNHHATQAVAGRGLLYNTDDSIDGLKGRSTISKLRNASFDPGTDYTLSIGLVGNPAGNGSAAFGFGTGIENAGISTAAGNWRIRALDNSYLTLGPVAENCVIQLRNNNGSCECFFNGESKGTITIDQANRTGFAFLGANSGSNSGSAGTAEHKTTGVICLQGVHSDDEIADASYQYLKAETGIADEQTVQTTAQMQEVFVQQSPGKVRVFWKANDEPQSRIYIAADFDFAPDQTATALESWSLNRQYKCTRVNDTESFTGFELIDNGLSSSVLFDDEFGKDYGGSAHGGESNSDAGEGATLTYSGSAIAIDGSTQSSGSTSAVLSIVSRYVDESVNIGQRLASLTRTYSIDGATRTLTVDVSLTPDRDIKCQVFYPAMYGSLPSFYTSAVWSDNTTVDLTDSSGGPSFAWGPFGGSSITISGPNITTVFTQTAGDSSNGIRIGPNSTSRKIYPLNLLGETAPANTPQASQFTKNTTISEPE